jgi:hypothetical protein
MFTLGRRSTKKQSSTIDLRDPKVRQEFLTSEMVKANQNISEGTLLLTGTLSFEGICVVREDQGSHNCASLLYVLECSNVTMATNVYIVACILAHARLKGIS